MFQVPPDSAAAYLFTARLLLRLDFAPVAEEYAKKAVSWMLSFHWRTRFWGTLFV